tara:strand:+ start:962 stop:1390 length:429 start_codon:yes stop_codon:yes gene_type:complete
VFYSLFYYAYELHCRQECLKIHTTGKTTGFMMSKVKYSFSKQTLHALEHYANLLKIARKNRNMTIVELTDKMGVSRTTVDSILRGNATVSIGYYFEASRILGINLFNQDPSRLEVSKRNSGNVDSLLPKRIRNKKEELTNDF